MKKVLLALSVTGLVFMASCNNKDNAENTAEPTTEEATDASEAAMPVTESSEVSASDMPPFSNPEVQQFANDYAAYINEVLKATANKDEEKAAELQTHSVEWSQKAVGYIQKMTQEERQNWENWNKKMAEKVQSQGQ